ncbi:MAG: dTDP-4-dehydrorhamnose 3,5-epimerase family protein [Candidatus Beckwithbacteria bacterium]|nr:dTDP-4-dehydrorhamnose 3,5-epimerase family protein [Candidatus Beckwithbacteria bacterium]
MIKLFEPTKDLEIEEDIFKTEIKGLWYIARKQFSDERGFFTEVAQTYKLEKVLGRQFVVKQINHSRSITNVVRGMHAEDWKKVITVTNGAAFCALADVRPESATFGKVVNFKLGFGEEFLTGSLLVEEEIANSFCVLKGPVDYVYCVDRLYGQRDPKGDVAISLFDPDLKIEWPIKREEMILSQRDKNSITLRQRFPEKFK